MKLILWALVPLFLLTASSCQSESRDEKEKEAILAVLHEESAATLALDKERLYSLHVQDDAETRLEMGAYGWNTFQGWDQIEQLLSDFMDGSGIDENAVNSKDNVLIKVTGNAAWLVCDNLWEWTSDGHAGGFNNLQIAFFEKIKGEWKISFSAYYTKP